VVDITETFDAKMRAIRSYRSQFHGEREGRASKKPATSKEPATMISTPYALEVIETMCRYYGAMIGARYGEPFLLREGLEVDDPVAFFGKFPDQKQAHLFPAK
jgi:hypothetical protein